ncbi:hypothetical protein Tco_0974721 [Tanacetum coccineum]|uniref:Uncharacterized protein n=1 Tax=Tanacetum coccineum TaxID=301880 RepID=A0ABQ5ECD3_9ASTR
MTTLQFADTHNLVAFLAKPAESEGFEQIVDFLNAHTIKYALTVNSTIYTLCTDCLPNATIFEELTRMGYEKLSQKLTFYKAFFSPKWKFLIHTILQCLSAKTTAWNKFSSTMASLIICLATNQKFNFSKYILESMVKNLDNADEDIYKERGDSLERAATTTTGLNAEQDRGNINKTKSKATPNEPSSLGTSSGGGPRRQETIGDTIAQTRSENVSKLFNDPLLTRGNTLRSGEDRLKLQELMELCTNLQNRVIGLENTKTAQAQEITSLKLRVKKLDKKGGSRTHKLKRLYKVGRSARIVSSNEANITLVDETQGRYGEDIMFDVSDLAGEEVFVAEQGVSDKDVNLTVSTRPKAKGLVIHEQEQSPTPTVSSQQPSQAKIQDKGKAKMIEPEPVKKLSKKDQPMRKWLKDYKLNLMNMKGLKERKLNLKPTLT